LTQRFQADSTQQINIYKQQIVQIQRDNEELQRRLNEFGSDANKKINKYEDDTKKMITEI
jgi:Fe2+ transport system protein FeoA